MSTDQLLAHHTEEGVYEILYEGISTVFAQTSPIPIIGLVIVGIALAVLRQRHHAAAEEAGHLNRARAVTTAMYTVLVLAAVAIISLAVSEVTNADSMRQARTEATVTWLHERYGITATLDDVERLAKGHYATVKVDGTPIRYALEVTELHTLRVTVGGVPLRERGAGE